jgi:hypothetical protein
MLDVESEQQQSVICSDVDESEYEFTDIVDRLFKTTKISYTGYRYIDFL